MLVLKSAQVVCGTRHHTRNYSVRTLTALTQRRPPTRNPKFPYSGITMAALDPVGIYGSKEVGNCALSACVLLFTPCVMPDIFCKGYSILIGKRMMQKADEILLKTRETITSDIPANFVSISPSYPSSSRIKASPFHPMRKA